jgi:hypothetical protein
MSSVTTGIHNNLHTQVEKAFTFSFVFTPTIMPPFGQGVDADSVRALFIAGMSTAAIAATHGVGDTRFAMIHMYGPEES